MKKNDTKDFTNIPQGLKEIHDEKKKKKKKHLINSTKNVLIKAVFFILS